jgi:xylulokinase
MRELALVGRVRGVRGRGLASLLSRVQRAARAAIEGMLCGLADGLDAVRRLGVTASRVLLVGGAAANPAVSHIAAQVFDAPVELPEAGEYVAFGAAVQAAWALSGQRPNWQVATLARPTATPEPRIREQYAAHAAV